MVTRLELLAVLVGTRLLSYFWEATCCDITQATLWTDSTVALGWIRSDPNSWKTFVCNRVTEIQSHTAPTQWRHCPGQGNPADHLSRGLLGNQIQSLHIWWHGPSWLGKQEEYWPSTNFATNNSLPEEKKKDPSHVLTATITSSLIDASKFSSYWKLVRTRHGSFDSCKTYGEKKIGRRANGDGTRCFGYDWCKRKSSGQNWKFFERTQVCQLTQKYHDTTRSWTTDLSVLVGDCSALTSAALPF